MCTVVWPQFEAEGIVDPLKYMCEMRQDRGGIIQTAVRWHDSLIILLDLSYTTAH